jgi:hypothetical protein
LGAWGLEFQNDFFAQGNFNYDEAAALIRKVVSFAPAGLSWISMSRKCEDVGRDRVGAWFS